MSCVCLFLGKFAGENYRGLPTVARDYLEHLRRGGKRPVVKLCSPYPRLFFFGITDMIGVDSCVFLIFTTKVGLKTRLNGVKSIRFEQCRKF